MTWILVYEIAYIILMILVCLRIIYDTRHTTKTLAYLLLVIFIPVFGILFYFSFGINYRKRKIYSKKLINDEVLAQKLRSDILYSSRQTYELNKEMLASNRELAVMLVKDSLSALSSNNEVHVLLNGENKFPAVLKALKEARHHIHIEYYIFEDDITGRAIEEILIEKAKAGVEVRFIYDDFGSRPIRRKMIPRLRAAGVRAFPFYRVLFIALANRLNYRNHRKIIVIDGCTGFVGGINISDRYVNDPAKQERLFWRDTHLLLKGPGVHYLQYLFLCDWNFCAGDHQQPDRNYFPDPATSPASMNKIVQIAASGPDSDSPTILYSLLQAIHLATEEILITTPYFIPGESIIDALIVAALGGVQVKLLVPGISDSELVNAAAHSYYEDLLKAGVEIYLYRKGFVHAKTMVADKKLSIVGTANMDFRSFEMNQEVNALIYDREISEYLRAVFFKDLLDAEKIDPVAWQHRPWQRQLVERSARLVSPLL